MMSEQPSDILSHLPNDRRALLAGLGGLAAGTFLTAGRADAGLIHPPSAPGSTPGPEPRFAMNAINTPGDVNCVFKIKEPGSYYLVGNVAGQIGKHGILIASSNVTIDLMGFAVAGVTGSLRGITVEVLCNNLAVRNGVVSGWGGSGIDMFVSINGGTGSLVENVQASGNGGLGIRTNHHSVLRSCIASSNANVGIASGNDSIVEACHAVSNGPGGISSGTGCTVIGCSASENNGTGIRTSPGSSVVNCTAMGNSAFGIHSQASTVSNCISSDNVGVGIVCAFAGTVSHCVSNGSGSHGFEAIDLFHCHARQNDGIGILLSPYGTATDCTAMQNGTQGIFVSDSSVVRNCKSQLNGTSGFGEGILVSGVANRIEGNNCSENRIGIHVSGTRNLIARNTCSANAIDNWDIAPNNACLVVAANLSGGLIGDSGGASPGSTNPNANYTY